MEFAMAFQNIGTGAGLTTFLVSMLPVVELRGSIPVGAAMGLPVWEAALVSVVGNMLPVPFIVAFIRVFFEWLRRKSEKLSRFVDRVVAHAYRKSAHVQEYAFWGLVLFVAIPLPGTGAWTGALIAALLDFRMQRAVPAIFLGVLIAAVIVSLATAGVIHLVV